MAFAMSQRRNTKKTSSPEREPTESSNSAVHTALLETTQAETTNTFVAALLFLTGFFLFLFTFGRRKPHRLRVQPEVNPSETNQWLPQQRTSSSSVISRTAPRTWLNAGDSGTEDEGDTEVSNLTTAQILEEKRKRRETNEFIRQELSNLDPSRISQKIIIRCCTWNVGSSPPPRCADDGLLEWLLGREVASSLNRGGAAAHHTPGLLEAFPDVLLISLQEIEMGGVVLVKESSKSNDKWLSMIQEALYVASKQRLQYFCLKAVQLVGLVLIVLVKEKHRAFISHPRYTLTRCGVMRVLGNKGAVAMRLTLYGRRFLIIAAHFTAHKCNEEKRVNDYYRTLSDLKFELPEHMDDELDVLETFLAATPSLTVGEQKENGQGSAAKRFLTLFRKRVPGHMEHQIFDQHDYVFFFGDLNSRLHGLTRETNLEMVRRRQFDDLLIHDELRQAMVCGEGFDGFEEMWIDYAPTYKFIKGSEEYASNREPAWCDRILFRVRKDFLESCGSTPKTPSNEQKSSSLASPQAARHSGEFTCHSRVSTFSAKRTDWVREEGLRGPPPAPRFPMFHNAIQPLDYFSVPRVCLSDHHPVSASFLVDVLAFPDEMVIKLLEDITQGWSA